MTQNCVVPAKTSNKTEIPNTVRATCSQYSAHASVTGTIPSTEAFYFQVSCVESRSETRKLHLAFGTSFLPHSSQVDTFHSCFNTLQILLGCFGTNKQASQIYNSRNAVKFILEDQRECKGIWDRSFHIPM